MPVSFPATITIDDLGLATLRSAVGGHVPLEISLSGGGADAEAPPLGVELPPAWRVVDERPGETYTWPQGDDVYDPFTVYEGTTSAGRIRLAVGRCRRARVWGKNRLYLITFHVTEGGKQPLCEFLETDDYARTGKLIAIIRGTGSTQRGMYDPDTDLPDAYRTLETAIYRDHIRVDRSWDKQAVLAHETDVDTMLAHSLIQADHRFGIRPQ